MAAWEVTDRVREDDDPRGRSGRSQSEPVDAPADAVGEAHLDELINEDSAAAAARLEEEERARAAALATAPIRVASASRASIGRVASGLAAGSAAVTAVAHRAAGTVGQTVGTATAALRERHPARRIGLAALAAVVMAAPAAGAPAPWASLVGASAHGTGAGNTGGGVPDDLFSPLALGPLPETLPSRGVDVPLNGTASALDTAANPQAAGLPSTGDHSIPATALKAYQDAADRMALTTPGCQLQWTLLAGIGKVESNHGRGWSGSERLTADGTVTPPILGPILDGSLAGTATLVDTDGGRLDGNKQFDRAVGPMQFVPGTWKPLGQDGNHDGRADPNNIYDAALATATFLCQRNRDLGNPDQQAAAVFAYNPSNDYVRTVLAWSVAYGTGADVDLSFPTGGSVLPPDVTGTPGSDVPLFGSTFATNGSPYADPEPQTGDSGGSGAPVTPPTRRPTATPSRPVSPQPTPSTTSSPTPTGTPTPKPTGTPTTPPPTTQPPQPVFALTLKSVTATRSKTADLFDKVTVTAKVDAKADGYSQLVLTLRGSGQGAGADTGYVTGSSRNVKFTKGPDNEVTFDIDGGFLGDSGVNGAYSASLTQRQTASDGTPIATTSTALGSAQPVGDGWTAAEFVDNVPSLQRIYNRVDEFYGLGVLGTGTRTTLQNDLQKSTTSVALHDFQRDLDIAQRDDTKLSGEAYTRLMSLASRLADHPTQAGSTPQSGRTAEPGPDPVRGPASG